MTLRHYFYIHFIPYLLIASTTSFADFIPMKIATGARHTCVLSTDRAIKCWGPNYYGQLGTGDQLAHGSEPGTMGKNLPTVDLGLNDDKTVDICAGDYFTCALTDKGGVKCWGYNGTGQLGQGIRSDLNFTMGKALPFSDLGKDFKAKSLVCGGFHACALSDQGTLKCWGHNSTGALGLGDNLPRGQDPDQMGDKLPALAGLANIQAISAGWAHTCALSAQGMRCWGDGSSGQLGLETGETRGITPVTIPGKSPFLNLTVNPDEKIRGIANGYNISCAWMTNTKTAISPAGAKDPSVKCWGSNYVGSLGTGNAKSYGGTPGTMGANLPSLDLALDEIATLSPHTLFTCALSKSGHVKCWGSNQSGQLGLGDMQVRGLKPSEMGKDLPDVDLGLPAKAISIGASSSHSCAILINNQIKCWGRGSSGELGYENTSDLGTMSGQMGEALPFVRFK